MYPDFCSTCNKQSTDEGVSLSRCSRCKVVHYCSVACQKTDWKAGHKQQCAQFVKEINTPPTNDRGLPDDIWSLMRDKAQKPQIVPLPRRDPKTGKFPGSGNPIMDAMMKGVPGRPVMSFGIPRADGSGAAAAGGGDAGAGSKEPKGLDVVVDKPFHRLDGKTWLHDRSEADVFKLLIDTYRLRLTQDPKKAGEDDAHVDKHDHDHDHDHDHGNNSDPTEGFRSFLQLFDPSPSLLPKWWTAAKAEECIKFGQDDHGWSSLRRSLTKADVIEHYGDKQFGVQLRLFGEQVYGIPPADTPGLWMLGVFKPLEVLGIESPMVDEF